MDINIYKRAAFFFLFILLPSTIVHADEIPQKTALIIKSNDLDVYEPFIEAFSENVPYNTKVASMGGNMAKGVEIVTGVSNSPPSIIIAIGARAAYICSKYIDDIPILFALVVNWEKYSLRNKKNITGIYIDVPVETQLAQFKMFVQSVSKMGVIYSKRWSEDHLAEAIPKAEMFGIDILKAEVTESSQLEKAYKKIGEKIDSYWMLGDPVSVTMDNFYFLLAKTEEKGIPLFAYDKEFVKKGGLLSISTDYLTMGSQLATMAKQIIQDEISPEDIEVERPIGTTIVFNEITAKKIGLDVNTLILNMADELVSE
jgi:putative ABC transport system substrate-binding protein